MNITTNAPELYAHLRQEVEIHLETVTATVALHKNKNFIIAAHNESGTLAAISADDQKALALCVLAIQAETRHAFQWLDSLERRMGEHIADCKGELPYGRWVVIDLTKRCLHLLESPRGVDLELPVFVGVAA